MAKKGLHIDYHNVLATKVSTQHGLRESDLVAYQDQVAEIVAELFANSQNPKQFLGWLDFPSQNIQPFLTLAKQRAKAYRHVVVIGIGGSSLGPKAIYQALRDKLDPHAPQFHFLENIDPEQTRLTLSALDIAETLVIVSSKSGNTPETLANFSLLRQQLIAKHGKNHFARHIIAITEEGDGALYYLAKQEGYQLFPVAPNIGGRYAVLGPTGLVPSALAGVDIKALLAGAASMAKRCRGQNILTNPAALLATIQYLLYTKKSKNITVFFSYSYRLNPLADWYRQLLAESTGKELNNRGQKVQVGITPIKAVGTIDQHSQLQLYNEGANDKLLILLAPENYQYDHKIPSLGRDTPHVDYLNNQSYTKLFQVERYVTRLALTNYHRPNLLITVPKTDARALGELFYLLELQVAILGHLLNINPFNQPGVELGKNYTKTFMRSNESF